MPNGTYGGVRGRKTKVGRKLLRFPPTRLFRRGSGEMETSPCQVSVLAGQCVFFTADIPLFNSNTTNFAFCAFKGVEETCGA